MAKYKTQSFVKNATILDKQFLGANVGLPSIGKSINDESYTITPEYEEKPDKLAYTLYNNTALWWVFAARNPDILKDPLRDFKAGTVIKLPASSTVASTVG